MRYQLSTEVNPIVLVNLVLKNTGLTRQKLFGHRQIEPRAFARQILVYTFIKMAGYSHMGAAQCVLKTTRATSRAALLAVEAGTLDERARFYLPRCKDAKDYARIMYEQAINTPLPKHRRAVTA